MPVAVRDVQDCGNWANSFCCVPLSFRLTAVAAAAAAAATAGDAAADVVKHLPATQCALVTASKILLLLDTFVLAL